MSKGHLLFAERLAILNEKQRLAVETLEGCVMVNAGPGSGKTELLAMRTANILKKLQVNPNNILLLTFTENAAFNMRERLFSLIGETAYQVGIYTFHGFANDIISKYPEYFFQGANFRPITDVEKINILEQILANLPKKARLASRHFEKGYNFTSDILSCIAGLKKENLQPKDFEQKIKDYVKIWEKINKLTFILEKVSGSRKFENIFKAYVELYAQLEKIKSFEYVDYLLNTLDLEIIHSQKNQEYKNLNEWRDEFFTKDESEEHFRILKDSRKNKVAMWLELAEIYEKYNLETERRGVYDFDDMIALVAKELNTNTSLRNELEEKFQFIMVDEFQDTNESQFSLIRYLTQSEIQENNPNLLVVGDDDQAIYKFQGAQLSNIYKFLTYYPKTIKIVLDKNYRSTQEILDFAHQTISRGKDRLEYRDKSFNKKLLAGNQKFLDGNSFGKIQEYEFENPELEYDFVSNEVKRLISDGILPQEISIISNRHQTLKEVANYLNYKQIPYSYEKKEHVLDKPHIQQLLTILEFINSLMETNPKEYLLPDILAFPFWNISRLQIWKIAEKIQKNILVSTEEGMELFQRRSWFSEILNSDDQQIKLVGEFLLELSVDAKNLPLEYLLDKIIGTTEWEFEGEYADLENTHNQLVSSNVFVSPFKNYYFGKDNFLHNKPVYLDFLFSLRTFIGALREFKQGRMLKAKDIEDFLQVYKNNDKLTLTTVSPFASSQNSVVLQTAYKSKGLEYEYVFIVNANESEWNKNFKSNKIGFPKNLKFLQDADDFDDRLRLFYVALTRAKHTIYLTYSKERLSFIGGVEIQTPKPELTHSILQNLDFRRRAEYIQDEKILLKRLLENYKMPVTHLTNFLNLSKVGPSKFIEQNLLYFPQAKSEAAIYGTAMHETIRNYYTYFKKNQRLPSKEKFISFLENSLIKHKMPENVFSKYLEEGKKNLSLYFEDLKKRGGIQTTDLLEYNFLNEGVYFDTVKATGKIDKISFDPKHPNQLIVVDYKTGKSVGSWEVKDSEYTKIKLHFYKYQLAYYKLLLLHSRTFRNNLIKIGRIEFIEPDDNEKINILELELTEELISRVESLAKIIHQKILNLDFPETHKYTHTENGEEKEEIKLADILSFEEDLLCEKNHLT